ncbi:MAG: nucleotidyltransferase domain-containing protein [Promethearchaeota archaeon]
MSRVQSILNHKKERKEKLEAALSSIKNQLMNFGAIKIILFGSLSTGKIDVFSDIDLFVLMPSEKSGKEWMSYIYANIDRDIACDIIVYNEEEFEDNLPYSSFLSEILTTGEVIYETKL